jgi:mono/diheme cytochrome c family protein
LILLCSLGWAGAAEPDATGKPKPALVWDAMEVTHVAKPGEEVADITFAVTNRAEKEVQIYELRPSCGCTVAEMPRQPWKLAPGERGSFRATADFKGKSGLFIKSVRVISSEGSQMLTLRVEIPDTEETRRARNQQLAALDRQAVFRNDCASCHVVPTVGKMGGELFAAACGICHTAAHRADMVPDLAVAREPRDAGWWRRWVEEGKAGTLMPAFAKAHGGPLEPAQVDSLVAYLTQTFAAKPSGN